MIKLRLSTVYMTNILIIFLFLYHSKLSFNRFCSYLKFYKLWWTFWLVTVINNWRVRQGRIFWHKLLDWPGGGPHWSHIYAIVRKSTRRWNLFKIQNINLSGNCRISRRIPLKWAPLSEANQTDKPFGMGVPTIKKIVLKLTRII